MTFLWASRKDLISMERVFLNYKRSFSKLANEDFHHRIVAWLENFPPTSIQNLNFKLLKGNFVTTQNFPLLMETPQLSSFPTCIKKNIFSKFTKVLDVLFP